MGYRAHTITQQREYGSTLYFRYDEFERFYSYLEENYSEDYADFYHSESEDYYEVPVEVLRAEIEKFERLPDGENCEFGDMTNGQLVETLNQSVKESKNFGTVAWEWF